VTWIVVGASAGLGRALAERLGREGRPLLLVAGDARDLEVLAADLKLSGSSVRVLAHDAADHEGLARRLAEAVRPDEELDGLLFPLGAMAPADKDDGQLAPAEAERLLRINFLSVTSVVGRFLPKLLAQGRGTVAGFGSVAAVRGRSRNVVYSASKRALESYFESLRHLGESRGLRVVFYTLGYLDTGLAFGKELRLPKADPARIADRVCGELGRRSGGRYAPRWWAPAAAVIRRTPWFLFRRLKF
jgi:short-subunit dehydrogenase